MLRIDLQASVVLLSGEFETFLLLVNDAEAAVRIGVFWIRASQNVQYCFAFLKFVLLC